MKAVATVLVLFAGPAFAEGNILHPQALAGFDVRAATEQLMDANYTCVSGENHDGEKVSATEIEAACDETIRLLAVLRDNGWCTDANRIEWFRCQ